MKAEFPDARSFGATMHFWADAASKDAKKQAIENRESKATFRERETDQETDRDEKKRQALKAKWESLPDTEKKSIREHVATSAPNTVRQFLEQGKIDDPLVMIACFEEMNRRSLTPST